MSLLCQKYLLLCPNGFIVPEKSFRLMNIFTSKVNNRELENQMKTMWRICDAFQSRYGYVPNHMALSGTPLGETMIAVNQVIPNTFPLIN